MSDLSTKQRAAIAALLERAGASGRGDSGRRSIGIEIDPDEADKARAWLRELAQPELSIELAPA